MHCARGTSTARRDACKSAPAERSHSVCGNPLTRWLRPSERTEAESSATTADPCCTSLCRRVDLPEPDRPITATAPLLPGTTTAAACKTRRPRSQSAAGSAVAIRKTGHIAFDSVGEGLHNDAVAGGGNQIAGNVGLLKQQTLPAQRIRPIFSEHFPSVCVTAAYADLRLFALSSGKSTGNCDFGVDSQSKGRITHRHTRNPF